MAIAGIVTLANKYTNVVQFVQLRTLLEQSIKAGEKLNKDDKAALNKQIKQAWEYILAYTCVVGTTLINACSTSYYTVFKPTIIFSDKMNYGILVEFVFILVYYKAFTIILYSDTRQLKLVITNLTLLTSFLKEISMLVLEYFKKSHWPKCEIRMQRRSQTGIIDFPTTKYYYNIALNSPQANNDIAYPFT